MIFKNKCSNALDELLKCNGDLELKSILYDGNKLLITLDDFDGEQLLHITIKTDKIRTNMHDGIHMRTCRIEFTSIENSMLKNENNYFIPRKEFFELMNDIRKGYNLFPDYV